MHTTRQNGHAVIAARGSIDLHSSDDLRERLLALINAGEQKIVVDLTAVDFCDSSGLNVLVRAYKHARAHNATFSVTGAYGRVQNVLRTTGLDRFLMARPTTGKSPADEAETGGRAEV